MISRAKHILFVVYYRWHYLHVKLSFLLAMHFCTSGIQDDLIVRENVNNTMEHFVFKE